MSLAWPGLTHCEECGKSLSEHEYVLCTNCKEKQNKQKEELRIQKEIEKRVKIEKIKMKEKIENIIIEDIDGNKTQINGYWKDNIFHTID